MKFNRIPNFVVVAFLVIVCFALLPSGAKASALLVTSRAALGANGTIDWGQLGTCIQGLPNPFSVTSTNGVGATGSVAAGSADEDVQFAPGCSYDGWFGNFTPGDNLIWTVGNGPLTISFNTPIFGAGAQIQSDFFGPFVAIISAFDGGVLLGTFTENGNSTGSADNSAIFIGVLDSSADITSIVLNEGSRDFSINQLSLRSQPTAVPEPASLLLLGTGLLAGAGVLRRKLLR